MSWKLYHKDGSVVKDANGKAVEAHSLTYDGEWMGSCAVSTEIANEAPIDFAMGDWLEYRGERFELNYVPGKKKQWRKDAVGDAFVYSDMKWNSLSDELARAEFLDVVLSDNELHYTALPTFTFYMESLDDLLDRLQANMNEQEDGGTWQFYSRNWSRSRQRGCDKERWEEVYGGDADKEDTGVADIAIDSTAVSVESQSVWEGLSLVNTKFDVNFITKNREVFVGTAGLPTRNTFMYGKGNGLYGIEQNADADQQVVTRLRAYGSDKNLPTRYYATLNMEVWATATSFGKLEWADGVRMTFVTDLKASNMSAYFHTVVDGAPGSYAVRLKSGSLAVNGKVMKSTASATEDLCMVQVDSGSSQDVKAVTAFMDAVKAAGKVYFGSGVTRANFPDGHKDYATQNLPDNMSCERLMLPGFPNESLADWWGRQDEATKNRLNPTGTELRFSTQKDRPWVESGNADELGVRPGSVYFDTEDTKNKIDEIYPTLEEMTIGGVRVDEIYAGTKVEDNGVFRDGQTVPGCTVELKAELDIDISDLKQEDFTLVMKTGMCAGRSFKVGGSVKKNGRWVLTLQRTEDGGIYYPYKDFQINAGDQFVLTGIELPDAYVEAASEKLLQYAIAWLVENSRTRYSYQPKVDEIFMARQHDEAMADTTGTKKSLHDTLKEGDMMMLHDADLGIDGGVTIERLTIKEEDGKIATYDITLKDDKDVGTLQKMQEQITAIKSGNGYGTGTTPAQVREMVASEGAKWFLSKLSADTAQEVITFLKGLAVGDGKKGIDAEGVATLKAVLSEGFKSAAGILGSGFWLGEKEDADGNTYSYIEVDRMLVRKVAEFVRLMIRDIRHVGGQIVLTPAAVECTSVARIGTSGQFLASGSTAEVATYRCYFRTEQDGKEITNDFAVGDLARCQTFNMKSTGLTLNGANRYYWRKVTDVGDGYIDLSNSDYDKSVPNSEPQAGDEIVQMGSATDTSRQGIIMLSAYGSDAPKIALYRGVDGYTLSGKAVVSLSKDEVLIIADRLMYTTSDGKTQSVADGLGTLTQSVATITADMGKIETRVTNTESAVTAHGDELAKMDSKIEQTAGQISLKVSRTVQGMENMLEGSSFDPHAEGPVVTAQRVDGYKGAGGIMAYNTTSTSLQGARWYGAGKQGNIHVEKGKTYTFGVWVKSGGENGTVRVDVVWQGSKADTSRPGGMTGPGSSGSLISKAATTDWELLTATFTVAEDAEYEWVEIYLFNRSGDGNSFATTFSRPILAEGDAYRGWGLAPGEKSDTENKLLATGIDIENQIITATADTFEIRNNSGEMTASVNEDGLFETNNAIIRGTVMAKDGYFSGFVMKRKTTVTPDNINDYVTGSTSGGYINIDFTKTGSYVAFSGAMKAMFGSDYPTCILPFYDPSSSAASLGTDLETALQYVGETIIIMNESDTTIVPQGGGTITGGVSGSSSLWVEKGWFAVLKCETKYKATSNACTVVWNGFNAKK